MRNALQEILNIPGKVFQLVDNTIHWFPELSMIFYYSQLINTYPGMVYGLGQYWV